MNYAGWIEANVKGDGYGKCRTLAKRMAKRRRRRLLQVIVDPASGAAVNYGRRHVTAHGRESCYLHLNNACCAPSNDFL